MKTGVLLLNLGTPTAPTKSAVRRYLNEFLSDPRVVDIPWLVRKLLLYLVILPFRARTTTHAYQKIWTKDGSPLLIHSRHYQTALAQALGDNYHVALGMRYAEPSIASAIEELAQAQCEKIIILPLFPQYSSAASGSAVEAALMRFAQWTKIPELHVLPPFYNDFGYQKSVSALLLQEKNNFNPEFILFSYHGLPERQIEKAGCLKTQCDRIQSCLAQKVNLSRCYRAQCFATTKEIAEQLNLPPGMYATTFQSRLGRIEWIKPYTDTELKVLINKGIKRLMIACPSFVVDCLETLEEIGMRLREQWLNLGGEGLHMAPCLNDNPGWVAASAELIQNARQPLSRHERQRIAFQDEIGKIIC